MIKIGRRRRVPSVDLIGRSARHREAVWILKDVVEYVRAHAQTGPFQCESGGQIFGRQVVGRLEIAHATGPYAGDERTRLSYRSDPIAARAAIEQQASIGLTYVGEWHTHAEARPRPSGMDVLAVDELRLRSGLAGTDFFLLIVGRDQPPGGLVLLSFSDDLRAEWRLETAPADART